MVTTQASWDTGYKKTQLLIPFKSSYNPEMTCTIACWLRTLMGEASMNTSTYKAHSIRSAATSKVKVQVCLLSNLCKQQTGEMFKTLKDFTIKVSIKNNQTQIKMWEF